MVASPEVCRANGAKSKGAITPRGKAISKRNATKHGLLSQQPPLLVTEDLSTFEGLVQGLIDEYQPQNPTEHFLIQQAAMGMLKQYRLWNIEAAIANKAILAEQQKIKFPDVVKLPRIILDTSEYKAKHTPLKDVLAKEKNVLDALIYSLIYYLDRLKELTEQELLQAFEDSLGENYIHEDRSAVVWEYQDELLEWFRDSWVKAENTHKLDLKEAIVRVKMLVKMARQRSTEITQSIAEINQHMQAIQAAGLTSKGLQQPEIFGRYQRDITRDLYAALDRLNAIRQQRINNKGSIGSFGQTTEVIPKT